MFKKNLRQVKTSAPLRNSDRRALRDRVVREFCPNSPEQGDELVPEGILSQKITTSGGAPVTVYLVPGGDPLWFTIGRDSEELVPTVYTLWKKPMLVPPITVPGMVIPVLMNGADLMTAGIVQMIGKPKVGQLVSVGTNTLGPALAVGRMILDGDRIISENITKGKAVNILHTHKDSLWALGSKSSPPEPTPVEFSNGRATADLKSSQSAGALPAPNTSGQGDDDLPPLIPGAKVSAALKDALLQVIKSSNSTTPAFPIAASTFYTSHILPSRAIRTIHSSTPVDIKHSTFKSFGAFLKQSEKQGLLKLKDARGEVNVLSVNSDADDVILHRIHSTVGDYENTKKKKKEREGKREAMNEAKEKQITVEELWKPHLTTVKLFEDAQLDPSAFYTMADLKSALNAYIDSHDLVNKAEQMFINTDSDPTLRDALWPQTGKNPPKVPEFLKREEVMNALCARMQPWHRVQQGTAEPVLKKGQLQPISVTVKTRQGKKQSTLITGHEPFMLSSEYLAETLRTRCASSTSVSPLPGSSKGEEVLVQGKQVKVVVEFLEKTGVPKKWIKADKA
ncbi:hypothetical protein PENSPDRAFT_579249 [Peniophora sp. CONT]|nr:hypothetical protein PENSPDRAFT_579249 [Peniophora sp. CONT]